MCQVADKNIKLIKPGKQLGFPCAIVQILDTFSHGSTKANDCPVWL